MLEIRVTAGGGRIFVGHNLPAERIQDDQAEREFQARQAARYTDTSCPECGAPEDWDRELAVAELPAPASSEITWHSSGNTELDKLRAKTVPIPGRPGARIDGQGREWYSSAWLGDLSGF